MMNRERRAVRCAGFWAFWAARVTVVKHSRHGDETSFKIFFSRIFQNLHISWVLVVSKPTCGHPPNPALCPFWRKNKSKNEIPYLFLYDDVVVDWKSISNPSDPSDYFQITQHASSSTSSAVFTIFPFLFYYFFYIFFDLSPNFLFPSYSFPKERETYLIKRPAQG